MKKSYILFITLVLTISFVVLSINILQNRALQNELLRDKLLYIQAKNHLTFLEEYILSLDDEESKQDSENKIKKITIEDDFFIIEAIKSYEFDGFFLSVSSVKFDVKVTKKVFIK